MAEYISLTELLKKFDELVCPEFNLNSEAGKMFLACKKAIITTPTADVVKVVRCKDCIIGITNTAKMGAGWYWCKNNQQYHKPDHYCGYGELKEREGK